jgi:hypothetical protein
MRQQLTARGGDGDHGQPIVCVDLNGVLDLYKGWKDPAHWDPPRRGAARFLSSLAACGFHVIVFTTRYPPDATRWLRRHGLLEYVRDVTDRKPPAHVFVDDRAVCFRGSFRSTLQSVRSFKAHWEEAPATARRSRARKTARRASKRRPSGDSPSD